MTPTEVADQLERALAAPEPAAWVTTKHYEVGLIVKANRALIVTALRALGEPSEAAVERAGRAACTERCAQRGEPPCWRLDINGQIDIECNCIDIARAALRSRAADES